MDDFEPVCDALPELVTDRDCEAVADELGVPVGDPVPLALGVCETERVALCEADILPVRDALWLRECVCDEDTLCVGVAD